VSTLIGIALATAAVAAAVGLTMWLARTPEAPEPRFRPFATEAGQELGPAWSPDGRTIAYLADINGVRQVLSQGLDSSTPTQITKAAVNCGQVFWHPDGTRVYFTSAGKLWLMGIAGGDPTLILDGTEVAGAAATGRCGFWPPMAPAPGRTRRRRFQRSSGAPGSSAFLLTDQRSRSC
jgi:hypothetical protein